MISNLSNSSVYQRGSCPSHERLVAFDRGELSDSRIMQISEHLDQCSHCQQSLEQLQPDPFTTSISELSDRFHVDQVFEPDKYEDSINRVIQRLNVEYPTSESIDLSKVDDYEIGDHIGSGQFGKVYKAQHKPTGEKVALKITCNDVTFARSQIEFFLADVIKAQALNHKNLVKIHDYGFWSVSEAFVAMERIRGQKLSRWLYAADGRPIRASLEYFYQILDAIEFLHSQGVLHRNLKPENIFIDRRGNIVVTDIGMFVDERYLKSSQPAYDPEFFYFSAPEQLRFASDEMDQRSDIFSLGRMLQRMIEFAAGYRGVSELENTLLAPLVEIAKKCTRSQIADRFANIAEIRRALSDAGF